MPTQIIINADDFGLSQSVNDAVMDAAVNGVLSSATIMSNMHGFEGAVKIAKNVMKLGVGVHLNLLRGKPLSGASKLSSITDDSGNFKNAASFFKNTFIGKTKKEEVRTEFSAQIERVLDFGIVPTHIDSEKHLHMYFPWIFDAACETAAKYKIRAVRLIRESSYGVTDQDVSLTQRMKTAFLNYRGKTLAAVAKSHNLLFTDGFFGVALSGKMSANVYTKLFCAPLPASIEIMCHPAASKGAAADAGQISWLDDRRVLEYRALLDRTVKEALERNNHKLISFAGLK